LPPGWEGFDEFMEGVEELTALWIQHGLVVSVVIDGEKCLRLSAEGTRLRDAGIPFPKRVSSQLEEE
jgi:hypothetical protein